MAAVPPLLVEREHTHQSIAADRTIYMETWRREGRMKSPGPGSRYALM